MNRLRFSLGFLAFALVALPATAALKVGDPAPSFSLTSGEGTPVALADLEGRWVVLYFYPKDFTSGCTLEAKNFERDLAKYEALNATIVGVSVDSVDSHKDFCTKEGLHFKLLSDPDGKVSAAYDSLLERDGNKVAARHTFLINSSGRITDIFMDVKPAGHSDEVLSALAKHDR